MQKSLLGNRASEKVMTLTMASDADVARWVGFIAADIRWCNRDDRHAILTEAARRLSGERKGVA